MRIDDLLHAIEHALRKVGGHHFVAQFSKRQRDGAGAAAHVEHGFAGFDPHKLDETSRIRAYVHVGGEGLRALVPMGGIVGTPAHLLRALPFLVPIGCGKQRLENLLVCVFVAAVGGARVCF